MNLKTLFTAASISLGTVLAYVAHLSPRGSCDCGTVNNCHGVHEPSTDGYCCADIAR